MRSGRQSLKQPLRRAVSAALLAGAALGLVIPAAQAQDGSSGTRPVAGCFVTPGAAANVNVRYGPGQDEYGVLGVLYAGQQVPVEGRNAAGDWYAVSFAAPGSLGGAQQGWIAGSVVAPEGTCDGLPVVADPGPPEEVALLASLPVLPALDAERLRLIFEHGQTLGNDPHVFTKVGDCNTDTSFFLTGFDQDNYDLGPYDALAPSIDYYAGSWARISLAGQVGYNALSMLDPMWADPSQCRPADGEGPLACEYRLTGASVAVMMFGPNDLINLTEEQYAQALHGIIALSLDRGVIPVLTTFTWHRDRMWYKALRLNAITVEIADEYGLPLINFWRAAQDLPGLGLVTDYTHLTSADTGRLFEIRFTGEEATSGYALRNLVTVQVLDALRRDVLAG